MYNLAHFTSITGTCVADPILRGRFCLANLWVRSLQVTTTHGNPSDFQLLAYFISAIAVR